LRDAEKHIDWQFSWSLEHVPRVSLAITRQSVSTKSFVIREIIIMTLDNGLVDEYYHKSCLAPPEVTRQG
jgi:hypothetical protein